MSRQPVDQLSRKRKPQGRDGIWAEIRISKQFTATYLHIKTDIHRKTISDYLACLVASGHLKQVPSDDGPPSFELIRDTGVRTPRVRKDGSEVTQGSANQNMWNAMRRLSGFDATELRAVAQTEAISISERTVKSYVKSLHKAGYLRVLKKAVSGKSPARYRLIKNTGPKSPQIQTVKQIWDPNLCRVTYYPEGRQ